MDVYVEDVCVSCRGDGWVQDEHPHCGSPIGPKETCRSCGGSGKQERKMTVEERISRLEQLYEQHAKGGE